MSTNSLVSLPSSYSALIFDCDGTLADTMPLQFQAWLSIDRLGDADQGDRENDYDQTSL